MRSKRAFVVGLVVVALGCDRTIQNTATIGFKLNPHTQDIGFRTSSPMNFAVSSQSGRRGKGEWPDAKVLAISVDHLARPYVIVRCFDADQGAVRVEVTFAGKPIPNLQHLTFDDVTRSDQCLVTVAGAKDPRPYNEMLQKGAGLELRVPSGDAVITFLAWLQEK